MNQPLHGLIAATHTPFHDDGSLAPEVVPLQAAHVAGQGIDTVFITGSTGEGHSLTAAERLATFAAWAGAAPPHRIRVIAHAGSNCLADARSFAAAAADHGLAGVAALAPSYYKPASLDALVDWCAAIASAAPGLPFYYYDIPALTGVGYPMDRFLAEAATRIPNLAGVKFTHDDLHSYAACLAVDGGRFDIPWGIDEKLVDALEAGGRGAVGSSYNFAAPLYRRLIAAFERSDLEEARRLQHQSIELIGTLSAVGYLGASKALMGWLGVPVGPARPPLDNPTPGQLAGLRDSLDRLGLLSRPAG